MRVDWATVRAVIFDVDGTLYAQGPPRRRMLGALVGYYAQQPWRRPELWLLRRFRAEREKRFGYTGGNLAEARYAWCAAPSFYSPEAVRRIVDEWLLKRPNQYLAACRYPGTRELFRALRARGIRIGIYSDYPARDKLVARELRADVVVSSTDAHIDRLKPDPTNLLYAAHAPHAPPAQCLFVGDRPELDGACARQAHMPFLPVGQSGFGAVEAKQYAAELPATLLALWLYVRYHADTTRRGQLCRGLGGAVLPWFSFPLIFVLAGMAGALSVAALRRSRWRQPRVYLLAFGLWGLSFGAQYAFWGTRVDFYQRYPQVSLYELRQPGR